MSRPIPTLPPLFAKMAALHRSSLYEHERNAARGRAEAILPPEAGGFDRALRILAFQEARAAAPLNMFAGFDEREEIDNPGHMAAEAAKRAEKRRQQDARRTELVAEFGSLDAVLKPCAREKALLAAVKPWRLAQPGSRGRWTKSLAGLGHNDEGKAPPEIVAAIEGAFSMPATYAEAVAEMAYWDRRNDDMELASRSDFIGDDMLDLPCAWRYRRVRSLTEHGMELHTLREIAERMRAYRWNEFGTDTDVEDAILRDLDALVTRANDGDFLRAIRRSIAPLAGCEDSDDDYRACVTASCSCLKAAREIASLVAAREAT